MKQKFFAAVCAAVLTVCPLTGCGAESSAEPETLSMQDLPYGSTLTEDSAHDITAAYDKRFFDASRSISAMILNSPISTSTSVSIRTASPANGIR